MADTTEAAADIKALTVNGEARESRAANLSELLVELGYGGSKVATAVNGDFVSAAGRVECALRSDDRIEIVAPRQGG
ncbi:MAG: sulfur carrier protein ThiS [Pseudomonadota bacterium]